MEEILKKHHYRRTFYIVIGLVLLFTLIIRIFVLPFFDVKLTISFTQVIIMILDGLFASLIVTIFIGMFIFWLTPEIVKKSMMEVIDPKEIFPLLKKATINSKTWIFKGAAGRYTRSVTIPSMAESARSQSIGRDIRLSLINPKNTNLCKEYAIYRKSLKSASSTDSWDYKKVRNEVVATIISALITKHDEPLLRIEIYLLEHFSAFRLDISDDYVVITKEDKEASALRADKGTYFYDSYIDEVRLHERQAKKVIVDDSIECLQRESFDENALKKFIKDINLLDDNEINTLDLAKITTSIKNPVNPYAK